MAVLPHNHIPSSFFRFSTPRTLPSQPPLSPTLPDGEDKDTPATATAPPNTQQSGRGLRAKEQCLYCIFNLQKMSSGGVELDSKKQNLNQKAQRRQGGPKIVCVFRCCNVGKELLPVN
ncbi:hypothetical protein ACFE04_005655 [Oxalis oulophora]